MYKEALLWKLSKHPNILPLVGVIVLEGRDDMPRAICLVTPWMENGVLDRYLQITQDTEHKPDKMKIVSQSMPTHIYSSQINKNARLRASSKV